MHILRLILCRLCRGEAFWPTHSYGISRGKARAAKAKAFLAPGYWTIASIIAKWRRSTFILPFLPSLLLPCSSAFPAPSTWRTFPWAARSCRRGARRWAPPGGTPRRSWAWRCPRAPPAAAGRAPTSSAELRRKEVILLSLPRLWVHALHGGNNDEDLTTPSMYSTLL